MNKEKIKYFLIPFILMIIINLGEYYFFDAQNFGGQLNPHLGIIFIAGLFFGPFGSLGAVVANLICDIIRGYTLYSTLLNETICFFISLLVYKLWYSKTLKRRIVTKPRINSLYNLSYLILLVFISAMVYSITITHLMVICYNFGITLSYVIGIRYFVNFVNSSIFFALLFILLLKYKDFTYIPPVIKKQYNPWIYRITFALIIIISLFSIVLNFIYHNNYLIIIETVMIVLLLVIYDTKPLTKITDVKYYLISEKIIFYFVGFFIVLLIFYSLLFYSQIYNVIDDIIVYVGKYQYNLLLLMMFDVLLIFLLLPTALLLYFLNKNIIRPIRSFSKIEPFIKEDEKIELEGLIDLYSDYINQNDEIGVLSRSYTNLINYSNNYIENVSKLEGEKQRIKTELEIAHGIQEATLPKKIIDNKNILVKGFSKAAKDVGGDFYDYYELDEENVMIIIGDASGKGVPAALFSIVIQNSIKLLIKNEMDPANVLYEVNNQMYENNSQMMFITLFLAIYNKKTHKLTYANAGHNPPLIKRNNKYEIMEINSEIALGILNDYEYENSSLYLDEEILLYTDGITEAQNNKKELYGTDRLMNLLNRKESEDIIDDILYDIKAFIVDEEQFDDMTLLLLKVKE